MSLNGLDDPKVVEAHEAGSTEPGAWFLLKYETRDQVSLLERGTGGAVEVRSAVEAYEDNSPLYGFLKYRRRTVIVKYLPEDCSRLIQARVAVHFNAVCERFSPYDAIFEISKASDLRDSKLSAACSLHASSRSNSTTSSQRKKRMSEIVEEEEDEQRVNKRHSVAAADEDQPATKRQSVQKPVGGKGDGDDDDDASRPQSPSAASVKLDADLAASPENSKFSAASTAELPNFTGVDGRPTSSSAKTIDVARRMSSQSTRPDLFSYSTYTYGKPKVKLGPRPSLDVGGRPQTAGNFRPVSQIPAGFKLFGKGSKNKKDKDDASSVCSPQEELSELSLGPVASAPAIPEESDRTQTDLVRPATSSGVSTAASIMPGPTPQAKPAISREKARLMKAKKLREQKQKKKAEATEPEASEPVTTPEAIDHSDAVQPILEHEQLGNPVAEPVTENETSQHEKRQSMIKADSAVVVEKLPNSTPNDQASEKTQPDSRTASPVGASSEPEESTKASSVSGSTDETVRGQDSESADNDKPSGGVAAEDSALPTTTHDTDIRTETGEAATPETSQLETQNEESSVEGSVETKETPAVAHTESSGDDAAVPGDASNEDDQKRLSKEPTKTTDESAPRGEEESGFTSQARIPNPPEQVSSGVEAETASIPVPVADGVATATINEERPLSSASPAQDTAAQGSENNAPEVASSIVADVSSLNPTPADTQEQTPVETPSQEQDTRGKEEPAPEPVKTKRKPFPEPIRTDLAAHSRQTSRSENNFVDDEAFMEELQSATVQEARSMLVAKTPVTPAFPSQTDAKQPPTTPGGTPYVVRTVSSPIRGSLNVPQEANPPSRSMSSGAAYLHKITQQQQNGDKLAIKPNVGSRISQRIKALEMLSATGAETAAPQTSARERPSSRFFSVNKGREASRSPSVVDRANSFRKTPASAVESRDASPDTAVPRRRERSGSVASRLSMFESPPGLTPGGQSSGTNTPRGRPETISVTARIVRDPNQGTQRSDHGPIDLKQSPLLVDHQRAMESDADDVQSNGALEAVDGNEVRKRRPSMKDFFKDGRKPQSSPSTENAPSRSPTRMATNHQNNSIASRLSMSSRRSMSYDRENLASSPSVLSEGSASGDDSRSITSDKKRSRASRLMHRLSSLSGSRGKNTPSPTMLSPSVAEEQPSHHQLPVATPLARPATTPSPSITANLGDVNVQFPDNLLWKRRNMTLDSQGYLILSALQAQSASRPAQGTKRYHLSEFRAPYVPDVEVQELPNSVVLDLIDGSGVQLACEGRNGQMHVLQVLTKAYASHASRFGP